MKKNKLSIAFLILLFAAFAACTKDNKFKEVKVTEVNTLYSPDDGRNVILQSAGSSTLYFEWEQAVAEDNGVVYYDVLFDKTDGDFSNPVFVVPADNNGTSTGSSITHKVLNKIGKLAGIPSGKEGKQQYLKTCVPLISPEQMVSTRPMHCS
jgi:starch-binding outer membrane protein SusE/F